MATTWEIRLPSDDAAYARQAAGEAFREVDRLERLLSRFQEGGEVWCVNHLRAGEQLRLSEETHGCLLRAMRMQDITGGAFHPGLGGVMDRVRSGGDWQSELAEISRGCLAVDDVLPLVACVREGFQLDLGAIGKGYALECVRALLSDWGFSAMLLNAGGSSLLGAGTAWEIRLRGDAIRPSVLLRDLAVGSSGLSVQGRHMVDVRTGTRDPRHHRSWAFCRNAADADALSTAAMLMDGAEIDAALAAFGEPGAVLLETLAGNQLVKRLHAHPAGFAADLGLS